MGKVEGLPPPAATAPPELAAFMAERGIGPLERFVRLSGRLKLPEVSDQELSGWTLCLSQRGLWLVQSSGRFSGHVLELTNPDFESARRLRYESGRLRDRLVIDGQPLRVPPNAGRRARQLIGVGRIRAQRDATEPGGRGALIEGTIEPPQQLELGQVGPLARLFLNGLARPDEPWLVIIELGESHLLSALQTKARAGCYLALSPERIVYARVSDLGDCECTPLDPSALELDTSNGDAQLRAGQRLIPVRSAATRDIAEWLGLGGLERAERLYEAARRWHLKLPPNQRSQLGAASRSGWLDLAFRAGSVRAGLVLVWLDRAGRFAPGGEAAARLALVASSLAGSEGSRDEEGKSYSDLGARWEVPSDEARRWLHDLERLSAPLPRLALELHRAEAKRWLEVTAAAPPPVHVEIELAEHELRAGFPEHARALAGVRLARLEDDESALFEAGLEQLERARWFELLAREAEQRNESDVRALSALARLQPQESARLERLARAHSPDPREGRIIERARQVLVCLEPGGLASPAVIAGDRLVLPLSTTERERLRHPLARGSARVSARLSELIAKTAEPDVGFLRDYCEVLSDERHPEASRALRRAVTFLSLPQLKAYISHGARSLGLRGFSARPPFVLIGASHLDPNNPARLHDREFDFAFAAELAHLAFDQKRVTTSEVLSGAAGKTREALSLLGLALPLIKEVSGGRAQKVLDRVSKEALDRAAEGAARLPELFGSRTSGEGPTSTLARANEELIAAHRLVQLTADRSGLVCANSLHAALRCMLLTRSDYHTILATTAQAGLRKALFESGSQDPAAQDLAFRVRALIAFYLSDDFDTLTASDSGSAESVVDPG
ncbi:MAG TPA: hypothetical protein VFQ61_09505 [Polyangiaceae bacterium]|nr:hypothetical protein [Polyangiaceae bacterium]